MLDRLTSLFKKSSLPKVLSAEGEKAILETGDDTQRLQLAKREDARPEVLYYLADDDNATVRRAIAFNDATPVQANTLLSVDRDDEVRAELARKVGRMLPDLSNAEKAHLRDAVVDVIETLARDSLPKVRAIVAEEIKKSDAVPKGIIMQLAQDMEDVVSVPVLEYSPLLGEDDLREIVAAGASSRALSAIAGRPDVGESLAADVTSTLDIPAISTLLTNEDAQIREDTLDQIMDQAESVGALHKPLALRPALSIRAMKRIASFVASALVHQMVEANQLGKEEGSVILDAVRDRITDEQVGEDDDKKLKAVAMEMHQRGVLGDEAINQQIAEGQREMCIQSLAVLTDLPDDVVRDVMRSKSGRAITALCWRAGLKMRTAYAIQTQLAAVPSTQLMAGKDGDDYPMSGDELNWHLSYFTED